MPSLGPYSPTNVTDFGGPRPFVNPNNLLVFDSNYATANYSSTTNGLWVYGFGITIPDNKFLGSLQLDISLYCSGPGATITFVQLLDDFDVIGTPKDTAVAIPTTEQYVSFGSSIDNWGAQITKSMLENPFFGIFFRANPAGQTVSVNHIRITVFYADPQTPLVKRTFSGLKRTFNFKRGLKIA